ncbi:ABC transporter permease subunit [Hydrogenibacillus sp. N12]|nr:ABC transporter permease subunit [Hydrogenibacillus sp. N12]
MGIPGIHSGEEVKPLYLSGTPLGFWIAHVLITFPYVVRFVLAGLSGYDATLERAAQILGARPLRVFWDVTLPLLRPAIVSGGMFAFLTSFDNVTVSLFLVSPKMRTLPTEIFSHMQDAYSPIVASVSSVVVLISVVFIAVLERLYGVGRLFASH